MKRALSTADLAAALVASAGVADAAGTMGPPPTKRARKETMNSVPYVYPKQEVATASGSPLPPPVPKPPAEAPTKRARKKPPPPPPPLTDDEIVALQARLTIDCNERNMSAASARLRLDTDFVNGVDGERKHDYYLDGKLIAGGWMSGSRVGELFFAPFDREGVARKVAGQRVGGIEKRPDARNAATHLAVAAQHAADAHRRASQALTRLQIVARAFAQPESQAIAAWRNLARITDGKKVPDANAMIAAQVDTTESLKQAMDSDAAISAAITAYSDITRAHTRDLAAAATQLKATWSQAAPFGTHIHAVLEQFLSSGTPWRPGVDERPSEGFLRFLVDHPTLDIYRSEMLVFNEKRRVMGSIDAIFRDRVTGKFYLCDFKVTKGDMLKAYDNERGTHPLSANTPACKAEKYSYQTNVYTDMFEEQEGEDIEEMFLLQFEPPACDTYRKYPVARKSVDEMEQVYAVIAQELARDAKVAEAKKAAAAGARAAGGAGSLAQPVQV